MAWHPSESAHGSWRGAGKQTRRSPADTGPSPLRSVHTTNFPAILDQLGSSLLVTTYQAGKLVILRSDGGVINTHFRAFNKPMGMAMGRGRLAIGTAVDVWEFRNVPAVAAKLEPPGKHDACFLPRSAHVTGDIQIHEMAYVGDDVWFVNTRFSCLATHDPDHSFAPVWRPKFISQLTPDDRCHLNGLGVVDGRPNGSPHSAKPTRPAAGAKTKRAAAS